MRDQRNINCAWRPPVNSLLPFNYFGDSHKMGDVDVSYEYATRSLPVKTRAYIHTITMTSAHTFNVIFFQKYNQIQCNDKVYVRRLTTSMELLN